MANVASRESVKALQDRKWPSRLGLKESLLSKTADADLLGRRYARSRTRNWYEIPRFLRKVLN